MVLRKKTEQEPEPSQYNVYSFINIGTNEEFNGIRYDFQKKYNLRYKGIYNLIANKAKTYKGWKIKN